MASVVVNLTHGHNGHRQMVSVVAKGLNLICFTWFGWAQGHFTSLPNPILIAVMEVIITGAPPVMVDINYWISYSLI